MLWKGFYHNSSTKKASASGGFAPPDPHQGALPPGPPRFLFPPNYLPWRCPWRWVSTVINLNLFTIPLIGLCELIFTKFHLYLANFKIWLPWLTLRWPWLDLRWWHFNLDDFVSLPSHRCLSKTLSLSLKFFLCIQKVDHFYQEQPHTDTKHIHTNGAYFSSAGTRAS